MRVRGACAGERAPSIPARPSAPPEVGSGVRTRRNNALSSLVLRRRGDLCQSRHRRGQAGTFDPCWRVGWHGCVHVHMPCACCMLRTTHTCNKCVHTHVRSTCMLHALGTYKARLARLVRPIGPRYACACHMCMQPSSTTQDHHTNGPRHARPVCPYSGRGAADLTSKHIARVSITPWHQRLPKSGRRPHTRPPAHLGALRSPSYIQLRQYAHVRMEAGVSCLDSS